MDGREWIDGRSGHSVSRDSHSSGVPPAKNSVIHTFNPISSLFLQSSEAYKAGGHAALIDELWEALREIIYSTDPVKEVGVAVWMD